MMTEKHSGADDMAEALMREALESVERQKREAAEAEAGVDVEIEDTADGGAPPAAEAAAEAPAEEPVLEPEVPAPAVAAAARPGEDPAAEAERLRGLLDKVEAARQEVHGKWMRSLADQENLRKRAAKERAEIKQFGHEGLALEMLGVLDNLERALDATRSAEQGEASLARFIEGVEMTRRQFLQALERFEVKPFDSQGQPFDPARHQAMAQVPTADAAPGTILSEMQRGYFISNRLLRPAMVTVARESDEGEADRQAAGSESPDVGPAHDAEAAESETTPSESSEPSDQNTGSDSSGGGR